MSTLNLQLIDHPFNWEEVLHSDVKHGDVAVCGDLQWAIVDDPTRSSWKMALNDGGFMISSSWVYAEFQIKFYRRKSYTATVEYDHQIGPHVKVPGNMQGARVKVTVISP